MDAAISIGSTVALERPDRARSLGLVFPSALRSKADRVLP